MSKTYEEIIAGANTIKNERSKGANTASRIGQQFVDQAEYSKEVADRATDLELKIVNEEFSSDTIVKDFIVEAYLPQFKSWDMIRITRIQNDYQGKFTILLANGDNSQSYGVTIGASGKLFGTGISIIVNWNLCPYKGQKTGLNIVLNDNVFDLKKSPSISTYINGVNLHPYIADGDFRDFIKEMYVPSLMGGEPIKLVTIRKNYTSGASTGIYSINLQYKVNGTNKTIELSPKTSEKSILSNDDNIAIVDWDKVQEGQQSIAIVVNKDNIYDLHGKSIISMQPIITAKTLWRGAVVSYTDDDFGVDVDSNIPNYESFLSNLTRLNIPVDIALIPQNTSEQNREHNNRTTLETKIDVVRTWEDSGVAKFVHHPIHTGWYNGDATEYDPELARRNAINAVRCLSENDVLLQSKMLVYPGDSGDELRYPENNKTARAYFDCAIESGGMVGNFPWKQSRYRLKRYFMENKIRKGSTWNEIKAEVKQLIDEGGWVILGGHICYYEISDTIDSNSLTTANLYDFLSEINEYCKIRHIDEVWNERRYLWDVMGN